LEEGTCRNPVSRPRLAMGFARETEKKTELGHSYSGNPMRRREVRLADVSTEDYKKSSSGSES